MTAARIYCVAEADENGAKHYVKATTQAQALRHVARHRYTVEVATAIEVADAMSGGAKVADATKEDGSECVSAQAMAA